LAGIYEHKESDNDEKQADYEPEKSALAQFEYLSDKRQRIY
jgi:hypothetical protein